MSILKWCVPRNQLPPTETLAAAIPREHTELRKVAPKRGKSYKTWSNEDKDKIGKLVQDSGLTKAVAMWNTKNPDHKVSVPTAQSMHAALKKKNTQEKRCLEEGKAPELDQPAKRGRPSALTREQELKVLEEVKKLRSEHGGAEVNSIVVASISRAIVQAEGDEADGELGAEWAKKFLKREGYVKRKAAVVRSVDKAAFERVKAEFLAEVTEKV
eukprot:Sspe_Gene.59077::Locus_32443_Transcript_1_1_Confidence_1.000_Length_999::g.59077::m.59077